MIKNLGELAAAAAVGGALVLGACAGDTATEPTGPSAGCPTTSTPTGGCPTGGCPTAGCPTGGCPTGGCPTAGCPTGGCPTGGCPTGGCPTGGCPTGGCPTGGCPTATSGFVPDFANSMDYFTQMTGPASTGGFHPSNQIWYTETMRTAIETSTYPVPVGSAAIKEQYDANGDVAAYTVMTKQDAGYNDAGGNWHYERLSPDGTVLDSGAIGNCMGCHMGGASSTDYLLGTDVTN